MDFIRRAAFASIFLAGSAVCSKTTPQQMQSGIQVAILPSPAATLTGGSVAFHAQVTGTAAGQSLAVQWSVPAGSGSIDANTGSYTAPAVPGTFTVTATSVADASRTASAPVVVSLPSSVDPTGLIPPDRVTVFNPGIPGGIPGYTTVFATLNASAYGNGTADAGAAINTAIQGAGNAYDATGVGQVVLLSAGDFLITSMVYVNRSGVVLRGSGRSGASLTRLLVNNSNYGVFLGRSANFWENSALNVSGSIAKGSQTFQMANADAANILVGDVLEIDQNDPPAALLPSGHVYTNGYVFFGDGRYFKRQPTSDFNGPGTGQVPYLYPAPANGNPAGWTSDPTLSTWFNAANYNARYTGPYRSSGQQIEIATRSVGASLTTFTIANVFHIAYDAARLPQVWHSATRYYSGNSGPHGANGSSMPGTQYSGIENLYMLGTPNAYNKAISGRNTAYCWISNVEIDGRRGVVAGGTGLGPNITLAHAFRNVVRDSYIHHTSDMINNAGSYGITLDNHCSDNLIENNISLWACKPIMMDASGGGNVVAYNYVDQAIIDGTNWQENGIDGCHETFCMFDLYEGNWSVNLGSDTTHGNAGWLTFFRNYASGRNGVPYNIGGGTQGLPTANLRAAGMDNFSGASSFVGNVLNAVDIGHGLVYEKTGLSYSTSASPVYNLGDNRDGSGTYDDGTAAANAFRHANYDNVNNAVVYDPSVTRHDLPNSLYLSLKPAFFGSLPWPWVDPASSSRVGVLPAKQRFDSGSP